MAIDERARHKLFLKLEEVLGPDEAAVMMEHLPPVGWADVATKHDVDLQFMHLRAELVSMESRLKAEVTATVRGEMIQQTHQMVRWFVIGNAATVAAIAGVAFAAARLT
jgi:hypothetical protein